MDGEGDEPEARCRGVLDPLLGVACRAAKGCSWGVVRWDRIGRVGGGEVRLLGVVDGHCGWLMEVGGLRRGIWVC